MLRCLRFTTSGTRYYYHPDTRPKNLSPARRLSDILLLPPQVAPREKRKEKNAIQFSRLFLYACPSSSFRCSRKRPSLLSLACASGRLSFAVGERYYCVYFLSAISFHVRTYADASFHITIQARSTNTRFTYVQSSTCESLECLREYVSKKLLAFRIKNKLPSHQDFGVFTLEVKKKLQATPSILRRQMGMCATTIYVQQQQQYTIRVLVVRTPVSSLSFQVQHVWYIRPGRHAHEPGSSSASCCCNGSVG